MTKGDAAGRPRHAPLRIAACTTVNALGRGRNATLDALRGRRGGLTREPFLDADLGTWTGPAAGLDDPEAAVAGPDLAGYDCRNNRLARLGLLADGFAERVAAARARYGADRVGVFVGTSTSGILTTELAYRRRGPDGGFLAPYSNRHTQDVFSPAEFCAAFLGLEGPTLGISTACSSSAKAFATASRHIRAGLCDAAVAGGVDSLCLTTLYGFHSLGLTSPAPCRPWDAARDGLSLGEAAAFALLVPPGDPDLEPGGVALGGYGESSDAHHMSNAHPEGAGALAAMRAALDGAGLSPGEVDYINLHGTATPANDAAEDRAVTALFGPGTAASSTKGWTGHTLGAAGALEAVIACLAIEHGFVPGSLNTDTPDPALRAGVTLENLTRPVARVLSNSFGFGGTNCSLLLRRWED